VKRYQGKKFVCDTPNVFRVIGAEWSYLPNPKTSLINVKGVGLCNSDFSRMFLGTGHKYPLTPGHEFIGTIQETTDNHRFSNNSPVCVFPLLPCKVCKSCVEEMFHLCVNYSYLGSRQDGALSNYIEVPNWNIRVLPLGISPNLLLMIEPVSVIFHAFNLLGKEVSNLLITGSGFLSYVSLCVAKYLGIKQIQILSTSKANSRIFADHFHDNCSINDSSIDGCIDLSGNFELLNVVTRALRPSSNIVSLANSRRDTFIDLQAREQIIRKELRFIGSWNSSYASKNDNWNEAIMFFQSNPEINYPTREIEIAELPSYLNSLSSNFPRERIHVRC